MLDKIWNLYLTTKSNFEYDYRRLPKALFQADLKPTNVLVDDKLNFVGLIDFNLSGTDVVLNYSMRECMHGIDTYATLTDTSLCAYNHNYLRKMMKTIDRYYQFTDT